SSSSWCKEVSSCSATPSGSITGVDNDTFSGVFSVFHVFGDNGTSGYDNTTDCVSNATMIANLKSQMGLPTGINSLIMNNAVTSSSSFAQRINSYSDTSCSTEIATVAFGYNLTVGDDVSGLTTSGGNPSTATKVTYTQSCAAIKASSDAGATFLKTLLSSVSGIDPAVGTSYKCGVTGSTEYALWSYRDNSSLSTPSMLVEEKSSSAHPSDWSDPDHMTFIP
ncbi:MAG: hypothetical protein QF530_10980, partial [SAR202 cluster bacterium]|nr:hypothetical protein [SAR202 cluster bacterium]